MKLIALLVVSCLTISINANSTPVLSFLSGTIQGLQNDSEDQSQCIIAFNGFQFTWDKLSAALASTINPLELMLQLNKYGTDILGHYVKIADSCRISANIAHLQQLFTKEGLVSLFVILGTKFDEILLQFSTLWNKFNASLHQDMGVAFGKIIKVTLQFSVS